MLDDVKAPIATFVLGYERLRFAEFLDKRKPPPAVAHMAAVHDWAKLDSRPIATARYRTYQYPHQRWDTGRACAFIAATSSAGRSCGP